MKAKSRTVIVQWMPYPDKRHKPIPFFEEGLKEDIIYELAGHYFVRTVYGTVSFTPDDVLIFSREVGIFPMRKNVFEKMYEVIEDV